MTGAVLPLGVTMVEPAGIGGEIVLKAWLRRRAGRLPFFVIDDPERARRMGANGRRRVEERFSVEGNVNRRLDLYRELVGARAR